MVDVHCVLWQIFLITHNQFYCESHSEALPRNLQDFSIYINKRNSLCRPIIEASRYVYISNPVVPLVLAGVIDQLASASARGISRALSMPQAISLHMGKEYFISTIKHFLTTKCALIVRTIKHSLWLKCALLQ